jgi:hypothetical protein
MQQSGVKTAQYKHSNLMLNDWLKHMQKSLKDDLCRMTFNMGNISHL